MIESIYQQAKELLLSHKDQLTQLAELLIEKEVIFRDDVEQIFGPRQWEDNVEGIKDMVTN